MHSLIWLFHPLPRERICFCCNAQVLVIYVRIDLGGVQVVVAQHFLECAYIHAVLQHQSCGGMAQFVGRILGWIQTGIQQMLFYQFVDRSP